jgi:AcrR family transcriptional regulator
MSLTLRNKPQQARSQKRMNDILEAAEKVLLEQGFEALSTNAVAAKAGISIGSLYHFFSDKKAILEALVNHYNDSYITLLQKVHSVETLALSLEMYVETFVDGLETYENTHPGVTVLLKQASAAMFKDFEIAAEQDVEILVTYYRKRNPKLKAKAERVARMVLAVIEGVTLRALDEDIHELTKEARVLLLAYLRLYFE